MEQNKGYDPDIFIVHKKGLEIALLPGIGRFCLCGCGRPIMGKKVTQIYHGKPITYFKQPRKDQKFASTTCKYKYRNKMHPTNWNAIRLNCSLILKVESDKVPYRLLKIHLKNQSSIAVKITEKQNRELWNICEKVSRYRTGIVPQEVAIVC